MSIRKRILGKNRKRKAWLVDYYQAGKRQHKSFKRKRDAEIFAKAARALDGGRAFVDDDQLDYTIQQGQELYIKTPEPLTIMAIINRLGKVWRTATTLSDAELTFLASFAAASDRGGFIEDNFLDDAMSGGVELKTYVHRYEGEDEDAGWSGLHRFFGMYVVNWTQYGEGEDRYGPFSKKKDAETVFGLGW
jgi:hypothetical protein